MAGGFLIEQIDMFQTLLVLRVFLTDRMDTYHLWDLSIFLLIENPK